MVLNGIKNDINEKKSTNDTINENINDIIAPRLNDARDITYPKREHGHGINTSRNDFVNLNVNGKLCS